MSLAIDASSPAIVTQPTSGTTTMVTASFTPPAKSLIYVRWSCNNQTGDTPTTPLITDNLGTHLTYTMLDYQSNSSAPNVQAQCCHWWAIGRGAAQTITVTSQATTSSPGAMQALVFTDINTPTIGAHGKAGQASNTSIAQTYTALRDGGVGLLTVADWDNATHAPGTGMTATNGGTGVVGSTNQVTYAFFRRTSFDGVAGSTNTLRDTITSTTANLNWVYAEVLPAVLPPFMITDAVGRSYGW
jgi:hypothetical protein